MRTPVEEPNWKRAACAEALPELFFPPRGAGKGNRNPQVLAAKEYCMSCPIRRDCLNWALTNNEHGIWGGMTDRERVIYRHGGTVRQTYKQKRAS